MDQRDQMFTFALNTAQVQEVLATLATQPYNRVAGLIETIQSQFNQQVELRVARRAQGNVHDLVAESTKVA